MVKQYIVKFMSTKKKLTKTYTACTVVVCFDTTVAKKAEASIGQPGQWARSGQWARRFEIVKKNS